MLKCEVDLYLSSFMSSVWFEVKHKCSVGGGIVIAAEQRRQLAANRANSPPFLTSNRENEHQRSAGRADMASLRAGVAPKPRSNAADDLFQSLQSWWEIHLQPGAGGQEEFQSSV